MSTSWRIFTFFNPYAPWDPRSWKVTKSVDTRKGGYTCLYIPTEVLMNEFNGRLTDSGQVVTDQIIHSPRSKAGGFRIPKQHGIDWLWSQETSRSSALDECSPPSLRPRSPCCDWQSNAWALKNSPSMSSPWTQWPSSTSSKTTWSQKVERTIRRAHQARGLYTRKETGHRIRVPVLSSLSQGDANCLCHLFGMLDIPRESWLEAIQDHRGRGRRSNHKAATWWRNPPKQRNHLQGCCPWGTRRCFSRQRLWIWPERGRLWWGRRRRNGRSRRWRRGRRRWWRGGRSWRGRGCPRGGQNAQVGIEPRRWEHPVARRGDDQQRLIRRRGTALWQRCLGKGHGHVQALLQAKGPNDAWRLPRRDDDRPRRKAGPRWHMPIHWRRWWWIASTSHRRGTWRHVPRQSQGGRVDARRNDVWGAPKEYADDRGQDIGDLWEAHGAIGARWIQAWGSPISYSNEQNEGHLRRKERDESQNEQLPM